MLYNQEPAPIAELLSSLQSCRALRQVYLLDNSPQANPAFGKMDAEYIFTGTNLGYGRAHNIALRKTIEKNRPYHLVLNPDVELDGADLDKLVEYMEQNRNTAQLMPKVLNSDGSIQYLCKLLPTPADLIFRRFLPASWSRRRMDRFELRASGYNKIMNVPYLSGSFMLLRTEALKEVGLFDERFFLYPEDIDLTRRLRRHYKTEFYPDVSVVHHHARGSYRNKKLLWVHINNIILYFNKWGWLFDAERKKVNREVLSLLKM